jgi:hypothetical protein
MEEQEQEAMIVPDRDTGFLGAVPQEILLGLISFLGGPGTKTIFSGFET